MLYESPHVRVSAHDGIATLWMSYSGTPVNGLSADRLGHIDRAIQGVRANPAVQVLIVRSARPDGFCGGFDRSALAALATDADAAAFAVRGQRVFSALADAEAVTVALLDGPCIGPGFDLALACDYRIAVTGPNSRIGFGKDPTCWGGKSRLRAMTGRRAAERFGGANLLTAREAARCGVIDHAFCDRRKGIELRAWVDRLRNRPWKRNGAPLARCRLQEYLAAERVEFRKAVASGFSPPKPSLPSELLNPVQPLTAVAVVGDSPEVRRLAVEVAIRKHHVIWVTDSSPVGVWDDVLRRGRLTPWEAEQAAQRLSIRSDVRELGEVDLVYIGDSASDTAGWIERELPARTRLAVPRSALARTFRLATRAQRVLGLTWTGDTAVVATHPDVDPDSVASVSEWFRGIGCDPTIAYLTRPVPTLVSV